MRKPLLVFFLSCAILVLGLSLSSPVFAAGLSVSPTSGSPGTVFTFKASGFENEPLSLWINLPNYTVQAQPNGEADAAGNFTFTLATNGYQPGGYVEVVHGQRSGKEFSVYFSLNDPNAGSNSDKKGGAGGGSGSGSKTNFAAPGFEPYERVSVWINLPGAAPCAATPGGNVCALPNSSADGSGLVTFAVTPDTSWPPGDTVVVAHGMSSGHEATNTINFQKGTSSGSANLPPSSGGSGSSGGGNSNGTNPGSTGGSGQPSGYNPLANFTAVGAYTGQGTTYIAASCPNRWYGYGIGTVYVGYIGFNPGETVSAWASQPDLSNVGLGAFTADARGSIIVPVIPGPGQQAGHYHIIAQGVRSGIQLCGHFDFIR